MQKLLCIKKFKQARISMIHGNRTHTSRMKLPWWKGQQAVSRRRWVLSSWGLFFFLSRTVKFPGDIHMVWSLCLLIQFTTTFPEMYTILGKSFSCLIVLSPLCSGQWNPPFPLHLLYTCPLPPGLNSDPGNSLKTINSKAKGATAASN